MKNDQTPILTYILIGALITWFVVLVVSLATLSKRKDIGSPLKVFWAAVIFIAPVLGLLFYLLFGARKRMKG